MFDIIDIQNLFSISDISNNFIKISDIQNLITISEVTSDGN